MYVFIAGPRAITSLNTDIIDRLSSIVEKNITVLVGDANGVDKAVQKYFYETHYNNVFVYSCEGKTRNNLGKWKVESIPIEKGLKGFDFYKQKDIAMAKKADYGFMIWNGESKGTLNNIVNLLNDNKKIFIYLLPKKQFINIDNIYQFNQLLLSCPEDTRKIYNSLMQNSPVVEEQLSLFDLPENNQ